MTMLEWKTFTVPVYSLPSTQIELKIYDRLTRRQCLVRTPNGANNKDARKNFKIFVCGPTVYDPCHLGHARVFLFYDLVARILSYRGLDVTLVMNVTDIDPKISARAARYDCTPEQVSNKFTLDLYSDLSRLGITRFNFARVSDFVLTSRYIALGLLDKGIAYSLGGDVYLDISKSQLFGRLSGLNIRQLNDRRLDLAPNKRNPSDLLLWNTTDDIGYKFSDMNLGTGFPAAPLQDLSVLMTLFNGRYQLHGGADDLIYPHHDCILGLLGALTLTEHPVEYWCHVSPLLYGGKKMSNSLDNAIEIREFLGKYSANVLRLYIFSEHYRNPIHFSESRLRILEKLDKRISEIVYDALLGNPTRKKENGGRAFINEFLGYIENDFDTVNAIRILAEKAECVSIPPGFLEALSLVGLYY